MQITLNIPNGNILKIVKAMKELYPIPAPCSAWVDEEGKAHPEIPVYTDNAWVKECIRKYLIKQVARYAQSKAIKDIEYSEDDTLVT